VSDRAAALRELYQEVILHHNKSPRNFGSLEDANRRADGHNPLCGDRLSLGLRVVDGRIEDVRFTGSGCAISKASASLMTESIKGRSAEEADALFHKFHELLTGPPDVKVDGKELGKLRGLRESGSFRGEMRDPRVAHARGRSRAAKPPPRRHHERTRRDRDPVASPVTEAASSAHADVIHVTDVTDVTKDLEVRVVKALKTCYDRRSRSTSTSSASLSTRWTSDPTAS
jgi:nitrogen fixation NifU-like protein